MKILFLDIETTPNLVWTWRLYKPFIQPSMIVKPASILCVGMQEGAGQPVKVLSVWNDGFNTMIRRTHRAMSEADVYITFYGTEFDEPRLNQEFIKLGLSPPPPNAHIDLKKVVAKKFRLASNKLAHVAPYFGLEKKVSAGVDFDLWLGCINSDKKAQKLMEVYNAQDVALLEPLYQKLLPWIERHPNMGHWAPGLVCSSCGSADLISNGVRRAQTYTYRRLQCRACGKWSRERLSLRGVEKPQTVGL